MECRNCYEFNSLYIQIVGFTKIHTICYSSFHFYSLLCLSEQINIAKTGNWNCFFTEKMGHLVVTIDDKFWDLLCFTAVQKWKNGAKIKVFFLNICTFFYHYFYDISSFYYQRKSKNSQKLYYFGFSEHFVRYSSWILTRCFSKAIWRTLLSKWFWHHCIINSKSEYI